MFSTKDFVAGQNIDLKDSLILANPKLSAFSSYFMNKKVPAKSATVTWIEETVEDSAKSLVEGADAPAHVKDSSALMENYLTLFGATASVSNTAQASDVVGVDDLLLKDMGMKTESMKRAIEQRMLYGTKSFTGGKYEMNGIFNLVNADNKVTATTLTPTEFNDTISRIYDAGLSYNLVAFMNAHTKHTINGFEGVTYLGKDKLLGMDTAVYSTSFGDVYFVDTPMMNQDDIVVLNPDYIEVPELIPFTGTYLGATGSKQSIYIETQLGLKLLNSKAAASFKIDTTTA